MQVFQVSVLATLKSRSWEGCVCVCKVFIYLAALGTSTRGIWALLLWRMGSLDLTVNGKKRMSSTAQQNSLDALELKISAYMHKASIIKSVFSSNHNFQDFILYNPVINSKGILYTVPLRTCTAKTEATTPSRLHYLPSIKTLVEDHTH